MSGDCPCRLRCCSNPAPAMQDHVCIDDFCPCEPVTECQSCYDTCRCQAIASYRAGSSMWPTYGAAPMPLRGTRPERITRTR